MSAAWIREYVSSAGNSSSEQQVVSSVGSAQSKRVMSLVVRRIGVAKHHSISPEPSSAVVPN